MDVVLGEVPEVGGRRRHRFVVDRAADAGVVDPVRRVVNEGVGDGVGGDEVGDLVHVDPEAVEGEGPVEDVDLIGPELGRPRMEEVGEEHRPRPHLPTVPVAAALDVDPRFQPPPVGLVRLINADPWAADPPQD